MNDKLPPPWEALARLYDRMTPEERRKLQRQALVTPRESRVAPVGITLHDLIEQLAKDPNMTISWNTCTVCGDSFASTDPRRTDCGNANKHARIKKDEKPKDKK